jgi:hypothetical protein
METKHYGNEDLGGREPVHNPQSSDTESVFNELIQKLSELQSDSATN